MSVKCSRDTLKADHAVDLPDTAFCILRHLNYSPKGNTLTCHGDEERNLSCPSLVEPASWSRQVAVGPVVDAPAWRSCFLSFDAATSTVRSLPRAAWRTVESARLCASPMPTRRSAAPLDSPTTGWKLMTGPRAQTDLATHESGSSLSTRSVK